MLGADEKTGRAATRAPPVTERLQMGPRGDQPRGAYGHCCSGPCIGAVSEDGRNANPLRITCSSHQRTHPPGLFLMVAGCHRSVMTDGRMPNRGKHNLTVARGAVGRGLLNRSLFMNFTGT